MQRLQIFFPASGITECTSRTHNCSVNAYCRYTVDGYNCTCHPGYYGDGFICEQGELIQKLQKSNYLLVPILLTNKS